MLQLPDYDLKVVLIGDSAVGKTSILTRFIDDHFNENLLSTIGVDFKFKKFSIDDKIVKLQIWDTAGQQNFRALTSAYYHSADAIVIVFDVTSYNTFHSIKDYWVKEAENNNKNNALMFCIANKNDGTKNVPDEEMNQIISKHKINKLFEVSAKTGQNVEQSFLEICKILLENNKGTKNVAQKQKQQKQKSERTPSGLSKSTPNFKVTQPPQFQKQKKRCCQK